MNPINKQTNLLSHKFKQFTEQNHQILQQNELISKQHLLQIFKTLLFSSNENLNTSKLSEKHNNQLLNVSKSDYHDNNEQDLYYRTFKKSLKSKRNTKDEEINKEEGYGRSTFWNRFNRKAREITTTYVDLETEMSNENFDSEDTEIEQIITENKLKNIETNGTEDHSPEKTKEEQEEEEEEEQEEYQKINELKTIKKKSSQGSNIYSNEISISFISNRRVPLMDAPKKIKKFIKIQNLSQEMCVQPEETPEYQPCVKIYSKQSFCENKELYEEEKV